MEELKLKKAFRYPFNKASRMFYILWVLVPIFGWFALGGYTIRIVKEFIQGKFINPPKMSFWSDFRFGFFMFVKSIPFFAAYIAISFLISWGWLLPVRLFIDIFVVPILTINFYHKETVESYFEFEILSKVFKNIWEYIIAVLKSIALVAIFIVMILILVGIPALAFTQDIFLADFYRKRVKRAR